MPFFWQISNQKNITSTKNKPSLRDNKPAPCYYITKGNLFTFLKKRASSFISHHRIKGSMTLEAAVVVPFFLFAMFSLISIMDMMRIKACMDVAVAEAGNQIAIESYGSYLGDIIIPSYVKGKICTFLKDNLSDRDYSKISQNISVADLSLLQEDNIISFKVKYQLKPDFDIWGFITVNLEADYYGHNWLGYEGRDDMEPMVFLSNKATVYHVSKNCKYLNVTIFEILYSNLEKYRNNSGEKYKSCNFCDNQNGSEIIYITPEGSNYHTIKNCIGLTRFIYTVPLSTVKNKRVCTGCKE